MSNISSLSDLNKKKDAKNSKQNEYFAGGLDQRGGGSGLAVLGPPPSDNKPKNNNSTSSNSNTNNNRDSSIFDSLVNQARSNLETEDRVNKESGDSATVGKTTITMYRNGFIVDDGPFRDLASDESQEFIRCLERGQIPPEIVKKTPGLARNLDVQLVDKRSEDYIPPPPPPYVAFSGSGSTLRANGTTGSGFIFTNEIVSSVDGPPVNESNPTTTLQIRAMNGKKLKIRLNQDSTVLLLAVMIQRETGSTDPFILSTGFPPVDLMDGMASIKDAGLLGAVIIQKPSS